MTPWLKGWKPILIVPGITVFLIIAAVGLKYLATTTTDAQTVSAYDNLELYVDDVGMAPHDSKDLNDWLQSLPSRAVAGDEAWNVGGNTNNRDRLIQSGRIIPVNGLTRVKILSVSETTVRIRLLQGIDTGTEGWVLKYSIFKLEHSSEVHIFR